MERRNYISYSLVRYGENNLYLKLIVSFKIFLTTALQFGMLGHDDKAGQLGTVAARLTPILREDRATSAQESSGNCPRPQLVMSLLTFEILDVAVGSKHMAAISSSHELWTWGCADDGRLGHGPTVTGLVFRPKQVDLPAAVHPASVRCGHDGTMLLTFDGRLMACGSNEDNKLGLDGGLGLFFLNKYVDGSNTFTPLRDVGKGHVVKFSLGENCARRSFLIPLFY